MILIQSIITVSLAITSIVCVFYLFMTKQYDKIRKIAYQLILQAEKSYTNGNFKMNFVVDTIYNTYFPPWLKIFVTKDDLKAQLQIWYNEIREYLQDKQI